VLTRRPPRLVTAGAVAAALALAGCGTASRPAPPELTASTEFPARPPDATTAQIAQAAPDTATTAPPATTISTSTSTTTTTTTTKPAFTFRSSRLSTALRRRVTGVSWHPGCPVGLRDLRYLRVSYWGFDRHRHVGELMVARSAVRPLRQVFAELFRARFPIRRMHLVDDYGGSDYASIQADNTSAFNCRRATGETRWSEHAYGRAVDVNTIENPYVYSDGTTTHRASRPYLDRRRHRRGTATAHGTLVRAFARVGWGWGGSWAASGPRDYQHFSASGH
jgi:hypothetical protein